MLDTNIREELVNLKVDEVEIKKVEGVLAKYNGINKEVAGDLYEDKDMRRRMKNNKLWDDKTFKEIPLSERYLGEGNCEITRQKLWVKADKIRIYFDIEIDEILTLSKFIKIK